MGRVILTASAVIAALVLVVLLFTYDQANQERLSLEADLQYRTRVLADSLDEAVQPSFLSHSTSTIQRIVDRVATNERVAGLGVFDSSASSVALSRDLPPGVIRAPVVAGAMDTDQPSGVFMQSAEGSVYVFAQPLHENERVAGSLMVVQHADYIDADVAKIWWSNLERLLLQIALVLGGMFVLVRWVFLRPLGKLAQSLRSVREGAAGSASGPGESFLRPLESEISKVTFSLRQARYVASEEARMRLEKLDSPWTAERLKEFIKAYLKDRPIFVVSNGEPYVHNRVKNKVEWSVPAGGVITALEPVMEACGGMWIAQGSGSADKESVDKDGKLKVPPEEPKYTLKRVFLTSKERKGYYNGFSNDALWPLCHLVHVRPSFRKEDWSQYRKVNGLFAKTLLEEIRHVERPLVLVQDYHLALVPALIKKSRPDVQVALFWHIPWPSAAQFSICPWRKEILEGMLGADLLGFHTQQYCNNFMDTVAAEIEARIDLERFAVVRAGHEARIEPFPISIAFPGLAEIETPPDPDVLEPLGIRSEFLALGADRLDYIKGIPERFRGVEFFLDTHPEYRERFTLLQIGSPTRSGTGTYGEYAAQVLKEAERINEKFATRDWKPIVMEHRSYSHEELRKLYQLANVCLVTSLHDGMNLVAKEFVAARKDEAGVLVLSQFAGASRDLKGALLVNPYSSEETAAALHQALVMSRTEQHRRMKTMRASVRDYNIYRWSAELIKALSQS